MCVVRSCLCLLFVAASLSNTTAVQTSHKPLHASELMALQAGGVLPENLVREINLRGLSFHPDAAFMSRMKAAGAGAIALKALNAARVTEQANQTDGELQRQLSDASVLLKNNQYDEAAAKLNEALAANFARAETGFVMGELLRQKGD